MHSTDEVVGLCDTGLELSSKASATALLESERAFGV